MNKNIPPDIVLTDGVLLLRSFTMEDLPEIVKAGLESIQEVKPWMTWAHDGYGEAEARRWLETIPKV